jgi:hypothetical protein
VLGRSCEVCASGQVTRRTGLRASYEEPSIARRYFTITTHQPSRNEVAARKGGMIHENKMALTLPLSAPHRPSMPTVPLLSQLPVHQGVPTDRNPISQSLSSDGIPELRARVISGQVPTERCYNAVLGKGTDKARTRTQRRQTPTVSPARSNFPQSEMRRTCIIGS